MPHRPIRRAGGFTLIELVVTVAVLAILMGIALPSFNETLISNRLANTSNEFLATLAFARSEAIRNNRGAVICPSLDGSTCAGDFANGWIMWADSNADGIRQTSGVNEEPVLRAQGALINMSSTGSNATIRFSPRGAVIAGAGVVTLRSTTCPSGSQYQRAITVMAGGMARVQRQNCA